MSAWHHFDGFTIRFPGGLVEVATLRLDAVGPRTTLSRPEQVGETVERVMAELAERVEES